MKPPAQHGDLWWNTDIQVRGFFIFFVTIFLYLLFPVFVNLPGILNIESSCLLIPFHFSVTSANGLLILGQDCWVEYSFPPHQSLHLFIICLFKFIISSIMFIYGGTFPPWQLEGIFVHFFPPNVWILKNGCKKQNDVFGPIRRRHF